MTQPARRFLRGLLVSALATAALALSGGSAFAAHQIGQSGDPGAWILPDTAAEPAARCSYTGGGVLGGTYLTGIRLFNGLEVFGTRAALRSVGYRPIVQHKVDGQWVVVAKGDLITSAASKTHAAALPGQRTPIPVTEQPQRPFRLVLKLIWYRADASILGTRRILVDQYVKRDGGVASRCAGFVSNVS